MAEYSVFPSLLPDSDEPFVDSTYQRRELEKKDYADLRQIAAEYPSDDVNGRMDQETLVENLTGKERVE